MLNIRNASKMSMAELAEHSDEDLCRIADALGAEYLPILNRPGYLAEVVQMALRQNYESNDRLAAYEEIVQSTRAALDYLNQMLAYLTRYPASIDTLTMTQLSGSIKEMRHGAREQHALTQKAVNKYLSKRP